jgi:capsular polysaccharide biosynthesis protein
MAANLFSIYQDKSLLNYKYFLKLLLKARNLKILNYKKIITVTDLNSGGYFHWFLDILTRLVLIDDMRNYVLLLPLHLSKNSFITETLNFLGINYCFIDVGNILVNVNVVTVKFNYPSGNYDPAVVKILQAKLQVVKKNPYRQVYISRAKAGRRKMIDENQFIEEIMKLGFEVVYCEDMNFNQTREFFSDVKILIAQHGAGLTNMLFMQPKSTVIEIRNLNDSHNNCYFSLASALDINYEYCATKDMGQHNEDIQFEYKYLLEHLKNK